MEKTNELEEINERLDTKIQSQDVRDRIIDVVCDSSIIDEKLDGRIDEKVKVLEFKLEALKHKELKDKLKFWIPIALITLINSIPIILNYSSVFQS